MNHKSLIPNKIRSINHLLSKHTLIFIFIVILTIATGLFAYLNIKQDRTIEDLNAKNNKLEDTLNTTDNNLEEIKKELEKVKSEDQFVRNEKLQETIKNIEETYANSVTQYEELLSAEERGIDIEEQNKLFAEVLNQLSEREFASASSTIDRISQQLTAKEQELASSFTIPESVTESNDPPSSGYSRQEVTTEVGNFLMDIVSADLNSTKVIVDTASDSDCDNDCPVLPLGTYVSRNGGFAGINGSYFCPASYPSCQGKTNSFDTLLMNKNKTYFNSENNVYSNVPVAVFGAGWARFLGRSLDWGRDTSVDGVIANQPLLLSGGNIVFTGGGDPKQGSRGSRSFVGANGSTIYIGVVHNATVAEVAYALKELGLTDALNLDSGGSTALWSGGYKVGPGRNIPNAIVFVRR